jgi:hypothetical protein
MLLIPLGFPHFSNSGGPHLHFHLCDGPLLNSCDAVPHVYRSHWLSGHARDGKPDPAKRKRIEFKVPTDGSFMTFPSSDSKKL